jgi:thiol-disulfide isomerase/thioredoxin
MRIKLDTLTNLAILLLCVLMMAGIIRSWASGRPVAGAAAAHSNSGYHAGDHLGAFPGLNFKGAQRTLLLFVRTTCPYCEKSMPFYQQLAQVASRRGDQIRLVALGPESDADLRAFFATHGVLIDAAISVPPAATRIPGTPTLVLVDRNGVVLNQWVGLLASTEQEQVVKTLSPSAGSD